MPLGVSAFKRCGHDILRARTCSESVTSARTELSQRLCGADWAPRGPFVRGLLRYAGVICRPHDRPSQPCFCPDRVNLSVSQERRKVTACGCTSICRPGEGVGFKLRLITYWVQFTLPSENCHSASSVVTGVGQVGSTHLRACSSDTLVHPI